MRVLIWLACILVYSALQVIARSQGIVLGGVPTVLLAMLLVFLPAPALCKLWGKRKQVRPAIPREEPKERWYTCPKCGQLVREGEDCDCEPKVDVAEQEVEKQKKKSIAVPVLSVVCVILAICICFLAYRASALETERAQLVSENKILNTTLHDLSDENARLETEIDGLQGSAEQSFSLWTRQEEAYKEAEKDWETLHDEGSVTLSFDEWWIFVKGTYLAEVTE